MKKKMALDVGDKTIGVAVSDALLITAQGITTIERVGIKKDTTKVMEMIKEYDCDTVVVGLPKKLDGTDSIQTEKVYEFKERLENKLTGIIFLDSSVNVAENLLVLVEQRQSVLECKSDDYQHNRKRAYYYESHLPAGKEHRDKYADQHNARLHKHTYGVLQ
jgi:putative transcription antitermination factor YqgF